MGKLIDADTLVGVAKSLALMTGAGDEELKKFVEMFEFVARLTPEAAAGNTSNEETGEWGDVTKIGLVVSYQCKKCGKWVVHPNTEETTYGWCPHCGSRNGEKKIE